MSQKDVARLRKVARRILGLPVGPHDSVVAADAEVVLGRDAAGVVERLLAGEDHRSLRNHHQDASRMHQHRRFRVPVGLGAHVDPADQTR